MIPFGTIGSVVNDASGLSVGLIVVDANEDGVCTWIGYVDGPPIQLLGGVLKGSPAGHYRLMRGETCVAVLTPSGGIVGPSEQEDSPWGGPATVDPD